MKFKSGQLFWGFFLLTIGVLFLLEKSDFHISIPDEMTSYWPLLIILWGIAIMVKGTVFKPIISAVSGLFLGLLLYGTVFGFTYVSYEHSDNDDEVVASSTFEEDYKSDTESATLILRTGASKITVKGITDKLISGTSSGQFNFKTRYRDNNARIILRHIQEENNIDVFDDDLQRKLNFSLNPNPTWNIDFEVGAASIKMDLSEYKVEKFNIKTGATTTKLTFGDKQKNLKVNIEMGAATMKIRIPKESACQIKGNMLMVAEDFDDFIDVGKNRYQTENFDTAENRILINFNGGVSTFKVVRY